MIRLILFIVNFWIGCVIGYRPGDEQCIITKENNCSLEKLILSKTDASTLIYPGGKTRCAFDDYKSSHYQSNATYFFQVFPKQQTKKLLFYFQGGGACISDLTCNFATQCSLPRRTFDPNANAKSYGILNISNPENMFRDWNIVHIPYCTGDMTIGQNTSKPIDFHHYYIKNKCKGQNRTMHMNGYENTMSALRWAMINYPHPEQIVIAGGSSGALAVQFWAPSIGKMWKIQERKIQYNIVIDSFIGVFPETSTAVQLINYFGACNVLPTSIISKCKNYNITNVEIIQTIIKHTLYSNWLHLTSKADLIQRFFLDTAQLQITKLFRHNFRSSTFLNKVKEIIRIEQQVSPRVSVFYIKGTKHVHMWRNEWYNIKNDDTGETLGSYMKRWLGFSSQS